MQQSWSQLKLDTPYHDLSCLGAVSFQHPTIQKLFDVKVI
jgi:hypothetical protein